MHRDLLTNNMAAPTNGTRAIMEKVQFPLKSGASLIKTKPLFSADNKCLFVASGSAVKVYSTTTGECITELCGHADYVTGLVLNPKNKLQLISSSLDKTLIIWDYADSVLLKKYPVSVKVHGLYTADGSESLFMLQTAKKGNGRLVSLKKIGKDALDSQSVMLTHISTDPKMTAIGVKGQFCVSIQKNTIKVKEANKQPTVEHRVDIGQHLTCVACHPNGHMIATGCKNGMIVLWYKFLQPDNIVKSIFHWHSLPVRDLCFTEEGSYLLSGGHECVLVKWHVDSRFTDFLPRLGSPINSIVCARDNALYATGHDENVINVVTSNFQVQQVYQGLTKQLPASGQAKAQARDSSLCPAGMMYDPRSGALVMNGKPGHIQFYSVHEDRQLYNLDIVCQNYVTAQSLDSPVSVTEVTSAVFDSTGQWLATVEYWKDDLMSAEISLKFWRFNTETGSYVLNTTVLMPHSERVHTLKMRPKLSVPGDKVTSDTSPPMAITTSSDGKFKLWTLAEDTDIYRSNQKWTCESVGFYRNLAASSADFSDDGSLVAVVFEACITLWDPDTNQLKETLINTAFPDNIRHVLFGNQGCSQYLVSTTERVMTVWSLITCSIAWSVETRVECIARDPLSDTMAVFTPGSELFVFRPSDPTPVFTHVRMTKQKVKCAVFIPHRKKSIYEGTTLSWQNQSELYFLNEDQELLTVALKTEAKTPKTADEVVKFERNIPQTALTQLLKHHKNKSGSKVNQLSEVARQPKRRFMTELFASACHVQPPVTTLCQPFIQSLLRDRSSKIRSKSSVSDDENDDEENEEEDNTLYESQTVSQDSGLDSDMEVDISVNQSSGDIQMDQSDTDEELNSQSKGKNKTDSQKIEQTIKSAKMVQLTENFSEDFVKSLFSANVDWVGKLNQSSSVS